MLTPFCCNKPQAGPRGQILTELLMAPHSSLDTVPGVPWGHSHTSHKMCLSSAGCALTTLQLPPGGCISLKYLTWDLTLFIYSIAHPTHLTQLSWGAMEPHDKLLQGWDWSQMCLQPGWSSASAPRESWVEISVQQQTAEALLLPWQLFIQFIIKCSLGRSSMSQQAWLNRGFVCQRALIWLESRKSKPK